MNFGEVKNDNDNTTLSLRKKDFEKFWLLIDGQVIWNFRVRVLSEAQCAQNGKNGKKLGVVTMSLESVQKAKNGRWIIS